MTSPDSGVISVEVCNFKVMVPEVVGSQFKFVGSPAVNSYPPLGTLKALSLV